MTTDPALVDQLADIIAEAASTHVGPRKMRPLWQAAHVIDWLKEHGWLRSPERQQIFAELAALRSLLGLQPGEQVCGHRERFGGEDRVCLLPASHVDGGHWHRGVGGSWPL